MTLVPTPGQTVGPFYGFALPYPDGPYLVPPGSPGAVRFHGRVLDGAGQPVPDALIEIWQPSPRGDPVRETGSLHRDPFVFTGWGRAATDNAGHYTFSTLRPGGERPFLAVTVFARGLLDRLFTRAYLPGPGLADDPFLAGVEPGRRETLIAVDEPGGLRFDIRLQGPGETVFLHFPGQRPGTARPAGR
ncbi:protocatechuate 3,4-dioxygenase subunit alpha [Kineosporia sp. J2-2]|uniref:Protocatechuate 3,4-dioxygenase subunit alpha n=1 Tax=Kineosporia corallincola TaxID=2835133 RepID=A0ABS5TM33_9ACTN|nr:protocatechuate 3,4-dioxygenase subunit alpha [Kineosporia corallincola]MBT0771908.1 protocatechuate 3,4-dioxygenase subunit alpha [Kineosporia corallincola]